MIHVIPGPRESLDIEAETVQTRHSEHGLGF